MKPISSCLPGVALSIALMALFVFGVTADTTDAPEGKTSPQKGRETLGQLQSYVGQWRGVGQPKRGSAKDAWSEECTWAWDFKGAVPALALISSDGKYIRKATVTAGEPANAYSLTIRNQVGAETRYHGQMTDESELIFQIESPNNEAPDRITIRQVASGDRMLVLYERKLANERFNRLAEVGLTRKGSGFGKGTSYVECVVTGGTGTIAVQYQGKTYYVCCTGCRDYFNDHPAEVLAEYQTRKEEEKKRNDD